MSLLHRRMAVYKRLHPAPGSASPATIPAWAELAKLGTDEAKELARHLGVPYTNRMATLSAINKMRG